MTCSDLQMPDMKPHYTAPCIKQFIEKATAIPVVWAPKMATYIVL